MFYETAELPQTVRLLDFNGDTFLDALLTQVSKDYHTILPGVGNGTFAAPYPVPAGQSLSAIHDWNGDGHLDLIGTISPSGGLVILGNGDGTFDTRLQIVPPEGTLTQVRPVDFEGDGQLELAGLNTQANSVDVWEHAAVTGENRLLSTTAVGQTVAAWAQGDFNSDGLLDLAVATQTNSFSATSSNQVVILINQGDFDFQFAGSYPMAVRPTLVVSGDFDGNGALDLAVHIGGGSLNGGSQIVSLLGDGTGGFQAGPPAVVGVVVTFMAAADSDNDLRSDLVLRGTKIDGSSSVPFLDVYAVDAGGSWTNRQSLAFSSSLAPCKSSP